MAGSGNAQLINGQSYVIGTPAWQAAEKANEIATAGTAGTAAGTQGANALAALTPSLQGLFAATGVTGETGISGGGASPIPAPATPIDSMPSAATPASAVPSVSYDPSASLAGAHAAAFGTAKDEAAQTAAGSLSALQGTLAARGMGGAGYEAGQIGQVLGNEANTIGAASRSEAQDAADLATHAADENYTGGITQRGQTLSSNEAANANQTSRDTANLSSQVAERGQTISAQQGQAQLALEQAQLNSQRQLDLLRSALGFATSTSPSTAQNGNGLY